jgi:hypothetical protein
MRFELSVTGEKNLDSNQAPPLVVMPNRKIYQATIISPGTDISLNDPFRTVRHLLARKTLLSAFGKFVTLPEQFPDVRTDGGLKLKLALEGEDVRDDLALSGVI